MTTETDIINRALDILKEAPISSVNDQRPIAMAMKRNFATTRDALLEEAEWNFAIRRHSLPASEPAPAFGWQYAYTLPPETIRVIPLTDDGSSEGSPVPFEVEYGQILTDAAAPLKVRIVTRVEDYARYPATFQTALSAKLAMTIAHWLTGKTNFAQIATALYREALEKAWLSDAIQGTSPRAADDEWVNSRS